MEKEKNGTSAKRGGKVKSRDQGNRKSHGRPSRSRVQGKTKILFKAGDNRPGKVEKTKPAARKETNQQKEKQETP